MWYREVNSRKEEKKKTRRPKAADVEVCRCLRIVRSSSSLREQEVFPTPSHPNLHTHLNSLGNS